MTTANTFSQSLPRWKQEMELPWAKLKYKLGQSNLAKHLSGQQALHILDAGGGNGIEALEFAAQGHTVELVDYSAEMLADAREQAQQRNLLGRLKIHQADVRQLDKIFSTAQFDLILCHNVLQYIEEVPTLLQSFAQLLKPNGLLSLVSINRYSTPYHAAFLDGNFAEARAQLEARVSQAKIFNAAITSYSAEDINNLLLKVGIMPEKDYGLRCLCDYWGDNERKSDPKIFAQIENLEFELTARHPYKLLARYFQVVGHKQ